MKQFIGTYTEQQVKNNEDRRSVENAQKLAPELKYVHTEIVGNKMEVYISSTL